MVLGDEGSLSVQTEKAGADGPVVTGGGLVSALAFPPPPSAKVKGPVLLVPRLLDIGFRTGVAAGKRLWLN